ncbi:MAG: HD domain-containing protein [bacterium]|nr:HD domain-containing protein [bacterium]
MKEAISTQTKTLVENIVNHPEIKKLLAKLRKHHPDSYQHSIRVGMYAAELGRINKLSSDDIDLLAKAGLLHDLGKCDIEKDILDNPGELDDAQRARINHHPHLAFIKLTSPEFDEVRKIVVAHHESKTNLYPRSGNDRRGHIRSFKERRKTDPRIVYLTQIVAAADIYDALKEPRSYKKPYSLSKITDIMLNTYIGNQEYIKQVLGLNIPDTKTIDL